MPGFVNCHSHAASALFRSQSDDGAGGQALYSVAFRSEKHISTEQWRDLALLGVVDMIRSGITTINDIWYEPEGLAEAAEAAGLRAQIALKLFDVKLEELYANRYERVATAGEERLRRGVDFVENLLLPNRDSSQANWPARNGYLFSRAPYRRLRRSWPTGRRAAYARGSVETGS